MRSSLKEIVPAMVITILMLILLEIFSTVALPIFGIQNYKLPFNIILVLYLGFKLESPYLPILILLMGHIHSIFSIEGWATATLAGVLVCALISYLRDLIHFKTAALTILVTQIFQTIWNVIVSGLIMLQGGKWDYILDKFWRFIPESIVMSLASPLIFMVLDKIWQSGGGRSVLGDEV